MKTNDRILILATLLYSYLFYRQNAGINFLCFTIFFIGILLYRNKSLLSNKRWLLAAAMSLLAAVAIFVHSSALAMIANFCGLLLLSAFSVSSKSSAIFSFLFSLFSVASSVIYVVIDAAARNEKNTKEDNREHQNYKAFLIFSVLLLCVLFFSIYRQSNPLFAANTAWINFNFISFSWVLFTVSGFFIMYGLFYYRTLPQVEAWENQLPNSTKDADHIRKVKFQTEIFAGIILFIFLNFMLLILNAGDINTIWLQGKLPKGISHSDFVHNGVGLIILSIVIATCLILFLYRYNFRSLKNSRALKLLVYAWVIQNIIMLLSTASRNQLYIHDYNLTYKRVGVYVWLFLAAIGLVTAAIKVWKDQSNWRLVKNNFSIWFIFLALSSILNWDLLITRYNLNNKPLTDVDFYYLFSLSDSNIPELLQVAKSKEFHLINSPLRNYTNSSAYSYNAMTYRSLMKSKIKYYLNDYKSDWQSFDLRDKRIMNSLIKQ